MPSWPREPKDEPPIASLTITVESLSPAERRDLANSLLRAAWCATLEPIRILLLDLLIEVDAAVPGEPE
jgi:hypothetical protein